jgi:hypothetical protein
MNVARLKPAVANVKFIALIGIDLGPEIEGG